MSEMKEKIHTGELYLPGDNEIMEEQGGLSSFDGNSVQK